MRVQEKILDQSIITLIKENNILAWEKLYDKYAACMYGLICNLTDDKTLAEQIFVSAFIELKEKKILSNVKHALCMPILRHTFSYATERLKEYGLNPKSFTEKEEVKIIHLLCTQCNSLEEVSSMLNMSEEETKKKLRSELQNLRYQKTTY